MFRLRSSVFVNDVYKLYKGNEGVWPLTFMGLVACERFVTRLFSADSRLLSTDYTQAV